MDSPLAKGFTRYTNAEAAGGRGAVPGSVRPCGQLALPTFNGVNAGNNQAACAGQQAGLLVVVNKSSACGSTEWMLESVGYICRP